MNQELLKSVCGALLSSFPSSSRFVFVPGPQDPGPGNILPR